VLLQWPADTGAASHGLAHRLPLLLRFDLEGSLVQGHAVRHAPDQFRVELGSGDAARVMEVRVRHCSQAEGTARLEIDGLADRLAWHHDGTALRFHQGGRHWIVEDRSREAAQRADGAAADGKLRATMNGRVVAVLAAVGDAVQAGQPLVTLEAMKMEHVHTAPCAGTLSALHVAVGDQVAARRVVAEVTPAAS